MANVIVVRRPKDHPKGPKTTATWEYGQPVPAGVIIGKGSVITVEPKSIFEEMYNELLEEEIIGLQS